MSDIVNLIHRDINTFSFKIVIHEVNHSSSISLCLFLYKYICNCVYIKHVVTVIYTNIFTQCYLYVCMFEHPHNYNFNGYLIILMLNYNLNYFSNIAFSFSK